MTSQPRLRCLAFLLAACLLPFPGFVPQLRADSLVDSDFEGVVAEHWPEGWPQIEQARLVEEEGNTFLRIESVEPGKTVMLYREIYLPEAAEAIRFTWKERVSNLTRGKKSWFDARIMMEWMDVGRNTVGPRPPTPNTGRNTNGWRTRELTFNVPEGARILKFMPSLFRVESGTYDFDDVWIGVIPKVAVEEAPVQQVVSENRPEELSDPSDPDVDPATPEILYSGRRSVEAGGRVHLSHSGTRIRMAFRGDAIAARLHARNGNYANLYVNGVRVRKFALPTRESRMVLAENLNPNEVHTVEIVKATESFTGEMVFSGFEFPTVGRAMPWPHAEGRSILFIGDSITCGYGIEADGPENPFRNEEQNFCLSFAGFAVRALQADYEVVARSGIGMYRNYNGPRDGSDDNLPALFDRVHFRRNAPSWDFTVFRPDVICINLGTNDFSTDGPDPEQFIQAGTAFLTRLKTFYPEARLLLLAGPMQNKEVYRQSLRDMLERGGFSDQQAKMLVFSPQGNHGYGAHWHPSIRQAEVNGRELTEFLKQWMGWEGTQTLPPSTP